MVDHRAPSTSSMMRSMRDSDVEPLATAFRTWPKERTVFAQYGQEVVSGARDVVVAFAGHSPIGYLTIMWTSHYPPFTRAGIPEICDFNVLPAHRRTGVGTRLLDEAERRIAGRGAMVGIGVGLYRDYGSAQRMYVARGYLPDGNGIIVDGKPVAPGSTMVLDNAPVLMFTKRL